MPRIAVRCLSGLAVAGALAAGAAAPAQAATHPSKALTGLIKPTDCNWNGT